MSHDRKRRQGGALMKGTTSDQDLRDMALQNNISPFDVFGADQLPSKIQPVANLIINHMGSPTGSHWTSVWNHPKAKYCVYFDSFGMPIDTRIKQFMRTSGKPLLSSTSHIQHILSDNCGSYCIRVLKELIQGKELHEIIAEFDTTNQLQNEKELFN